MPLYNLRYDVQGYYVEAETMVLAIGAWQQHWAEECEGDPDEEPDQVTLIHDDAIIRENMAADRDRDEEGGRAELRCPLCNYSAEDEALNLDHHICEARGGAIPKS